MMYFHNFKLHPECIRKTHLLVGILFCPTSYKDEEEHLLKPGFKILIFILEALQVI